MWSLKILLEYNKEIFDQVKKIGKFFGLVYQHELLSSLNNGKQFNMIANNLTIKDLIKFMKEEFSQMKDLLVPEKEFSFIPKLIKSDDHAKIEIVQNQPIAVSLEQFLDFFPNLEAIMGRYNGLLLYINSVKRNDLIPELEQFVQAVMAGKNYLLKREQEKRKREIQELIEAKIELLKDQYLWIDKFKKNFNPTSNDYLDDRIIEIIDF